LFENDFENIHNRKVKAKTISDGWTVELERKWNVSNNNNSSCVKVNGTIKELNNLKVEKKLNSSNTATAKFTYVVPLENKHFLELEGQGEVNWNDKFCTAYLQTRWSPCNWFKGVLKLSDKSLWRSHAS